MQMLMLKFIYLNGAWGHVLVVLAFGRLRWEDYWSQWVGEQLGQYSEALDPKVHTCLYYIVGWCWVCYLLLKSYKRGTMFFWVGCRLRIFSLNLRKSNFWFYFCDHVYKLSPSFCKLLWEKGLLVKGFCNPLVEAI
jgi:hypothetical protein